MSQIQKKFIAPNAVDETKIRLSNDATLKARNAANSGNVDILKVNASDDVEMSSFFQTPAMAPDSDYDVANKKYVDDEIAGVSTSGAAVDITYDNSSSGLTASNVQAAIDEVEGRVDSAESSITANSAKIGHLETLSGRPSGSDDLGTFTGSTIPDTQTIKQALQALETSVETKAADSAVIKKDGSVTYTGDQPMGSHKLTGLSAGSGAGDSVRYEQAILASGANAFGANQSFGGNKATNVADPTSAQDAATKAYVDAVSAGLRPKQAVRVASTANVVIASALEAGDTIDGVTLVAGDRVLLKDQSAPAQNGIYIASASGAASRSTDFDSITPIDEINGAWVSVQEGTANAGHVYVQYGVVATVGTDAINFTFWDPIASLTGGDMITKSGNNLSVDLASTSGLESSNPGNAAGQLRVKLEASNPSLQISGSNELGAKLDAAGAITSGASGLKVGVDGSTTEISSNQVRVKDAGITLAKLASNSVDENKIVSTAISTTGALNGGGGTKLSARVDGATAKINGSNNIEALKHLEQKITLSGTDITNQYVDLAHAIHGADAANNSASLFAVGGPMQEKAVDYTVSLTGGSGGVTRITFAGDLATGGAAALVAADKLVIAYDYLT